MKSGAIAGGTVLVLFGTMAVCAGEFWEEKAYSAWSAKEVEKILNDSPWAVTIKLPPFSGKFPPTSGGHEPRAAAIPLDRDPIDPFPRDTPNEWWDRLTVRWLSSRTAREAVARHWQLTNPAQQAGANQLASAELEHYSVALDSLFLPLDVQKVRETASLQLLPGHKKVLPVLVEVVRESALIYPAAQILIRFPKEVDGHPLITPKVNAAEFQCSFDESERRVKVKFNLRKMVRDGKPDL